MTLNLIISPFFQKLFLGGGWLTRITVIKVLLPEIISNQVGDCLLPAKSWHKLSFHIFNLLLYCNFAWTSSKWFQVLFPMKCWSQPSLKMTAGRLPISQAVTSHLHLQFNPWSPPQSPVQPTWSPLQSQIVLLHTHLSFTPSPQEQYQVAVSISSDCPAISIPTSTHPDLWVLSS